MRTRGFSLLEVMVVLIIIAMAYTLLPKIAFSGVTGAELRSNVRAVATGLRLARDTAINRRRESALKLDLESREFTVGDQTRVHKLNDKLDVKLYTSQADLISEKVGFIRFYPDGSSNGGRVTVGAGGRNFEVDVDWLTGHVTINEAAVDSARG
jgi:general secretion pathway protein H